MYTITHSKLLANHCMVCYCSSPSLGLFPPDTAGFAAISGFASPPEHIISTVATRVRCVSTASVGLAVLVNGNEVISSSGTNLFHTGINTAGFYQCVSSRMSGSDNLFASEEETIYILRACECPIVYCNITITYRALYTHEYFVSEATSARGILHSVLDHSFSILCNYSS